MENMAYTVKSGKSFDEISGDLEKAVPANNCNAGFAYQAVKSDINVAMFMPCKIVIRPDQDGTLMTLVRPSMIAEMLPDAGLNDLAVEVEKQLKSIIDEIK